MIREPVAIGFYPSDPKELKKTIEWCFLSKYGPGKIPKTSEEEEKHIFGGISPHAGYVFSGPVAAHLYYDLAVEGHRKTVVLLGTNHRYPMGICAIMTKGKWLTPLGEVDVDEKLGNKILNSTNLVVEDREAHRYEHSIEVQIPFLQYIYGSNFKIVPIIVGLSYYEDLRDFGRSLSDCLKGEEFIVIASSDFTHYGLAYGYAPAGAGPVEKILDWMKKNDKEAISYIEEMKSREFYDIVSQKQMTICGYAPITSLIETMKGLGIEKCKLLKYATSWETCKRYRSSDQIVGYASLEFSRE
ncbi:MAG: AmmeMemoRadiSam system protein B [Candidatus Asgardarchaeia archaeon]